MNTMHICEICGHSFPNTEGAYIEEEYCVIGNGIYICESCYKAHKPKLMKMVNNHVFNYQDS